jgi:uroporphyrinogen-III synthase
MRTAPLTGLSLWVTRPEPENERSAEFWAATGATPIIQPLLKIVGAEISAANIDELETQNPRHIVFTSGRAVEHLLRILDSRSALLDRLRSLPAWSVGRTTTERARSAGFADLRENRGKSAHDLAKQMLLEIDGEQLVFFPGAMQRRPELPRVLEGAGIPLSEWSVYDSVPLRSTEQVEWLRRTSPLLLLLYSPSAARAAAALLSDDERSAVPVATLGATTTSAAEDLSLQIVASAASPSEDSLLEALTSWWLEQSKEES